MRNHFQTLKIYELIEITNKLKEKKKSLKYLRDCEIAIFQRTYKSETNENVELKIIKYFGITNDLELKEKQVVEIDSVRYEITHIPQNNGSGRRTIYFDREVNANVIN